MALVDTHSIVEDLIAAGFAKSQAEALTRLKILYYEDLATKKDLVNIEHSVDRVKTEVAEVRTEVIHVQHDLERRLDTIDNNFTWMKGIGIALLILGIKIAFFN